MNDIKDQIDTLNQIRGLMERSSKLVTLSGLSGIAAGAVATLGAIAVSLYLNIGIFEQTTEIINTGKNQNIQSLFSIFIFAIVVFLLALVVSMFFSSRNAKNKKVIFWDAMAKRVFINLFIFLLSGGIFCAILIYYGIYFLIVPSMLIFYGLALINISKFTFNEIAQLGILEICLGIFSSFVIVYPLLIWLIGFGIFHLIYGTYVYYKYERVKT